MQQFGFRRTFALHRVRSRLVSSRTQLANQIRGLLSEYGIVLPPHVSQVRRGLPLILEDATNELTAFSRRLFASLYDELLSLDDYPWFSFPVLGHS